MADTLLDRLVGDSALVLTVAGDVLPLTDVGSIVIRYGRDSPSYDIDAATATFSYLAASASDAPEFGADVTIDLGADAIAKFGLAGAELTAAQRRFTGRVTDIGVLPPAGDGRVAVSVVAASTLARVARGPKLTDTETYPNDWFTSFAYDGARVDHILDVANAAMDPYAPPFPGPDAFDYIIDTPGDVLVGPFPAGAARKPLEMIRDVEHSTGGILWEDRNGVIHYDSRDARRGIAESVTLLPEEILWPMTWVKNLEGVANSATIQDGDEPFADYYTLTDTLGVSLIDELVEASFTELLITGAAACRLFLNRFLANRSRPRWKIPDLVVDLIRRFPGAAAPDVLSAAKARALLGANVGTLVQVSGLPDSLFSSDRVWIEGWTETITPTGWRFAINVAEYGTTGAAPRWQDVNPAMTWADVPTDLAWFQAAAWDASA